MQALYKAGLRPSWRRASIAWRENDTWYYIYPGEIQENLPVESIVAFAKNPKQTPPAPETTDVPTAAAGPPDLTNLVTSLQQDVALTKQRVAAKTVECCFIRQKLKRAEAKLATVVLPPKVSNKLCQTEVDSVCNEPTLIDTHNIEVQTNAVAHPILQHTQLTAFLQQVRRAMQ